MRHVRRFSFQYYDFVRQCHAFDLAWRHFDHLPLLKFAHFAHFPNLSLDTPASLESSSSVWIGSAFSEICKSWGLIPPVDVACFSFAFAWTLQPAWKVRHRCEFGLYQISVKVHFYTGYHEIQLASLSPLLGSRFSFSRPIRDMPYFPLQGQSRRFYPFGIVYLCKFLHSFYGFLLAFGLSICFRLFKTTIKGRCIFEVLPIHTLRLTRSSDLRNADRCNIHQNSYNTTLCPQT